MKFILTVIIVLKKNYLLSYWVYLYILLVILFYLYIADTFSLWTRTFRSFI